MTVPPSVPSRVNENRGYVPGDPAGVRYDAPRWTLVAFALDLLLVRRRSFVADARRVLDANPHPRTVEGVEHIPASGPFVVAMNHLSRRGLRPYHCAMVVSDAVASKRPGQPEIRWMFTSEYVGQHLGIIPIPAVLVRWVFARVAAVYGFLVVPRRAELRMARASMLRDAIRTAHAQPVGLTPEGVEASGPLVEPPAGNGLFLLSLTDRGAPILPVGAWEEEDRLVVRFGPPFTLSVPADAPRSDRDREARARVMTAIGALMPRRYWGVYAGQIAARHPT